MSAQTFAPPLHPRLGARQDMSFQTGLVHLIQIFQIAQRDRLTVVFQAFGQRTRQALRQGVQRHGFVEFPHQIVRQFHLLLLLAQALGQGVARHFVEPGAGVDDLALLGPLGNHVEAAWIMA